MTENLDYKLYEERFCISASRQIPEDRFQAALKKAERFLNVVTFGRLSHAEPTEDTSACLCELAELFYEESFRSGLKSETADGYSATYDGDIFRRASEIASMYLAGSGLMFQGVAE